SIPAPGTDVYPSADLPTCCARMDVAGAGRVARSPHRRPAPILGTWRAEGQQTNGIAAAARSTPVARDQDREERKRRLAAPSGIVVERRRIELPTFALRTRRSPS